MYNFQTNPPRAISFNGKGETQRTEGKGQPSDKARQPHKWDTPKGYIYTHTLQCIFGVYDFVSSDVFVASFKLVENNHPTIKKPCPLFVQLLSTKST